MVKISILALQGAFIEHKKMLDRLNVEHFLIRKRSDLLQHMDGLILPGGESTVMGKLLDDLDLKEDIRSKISKGLPVFGTCAGMILLGANIEESDTKHLACMDITVRRNAYGRQLGSFSTVSSFNNTLVPMVFIRAPYIGKVGDGVKIMSTVDGHVVAAQENNMLVTSFHPELTEDTTVHSYFINNIVIPNVSK